LEPRPEALAWQACSNSPDYRLPARGNKQARKVDSMALALGNKQEWLGSVVDTTNNSPQAPRAWRLRTSGNP
jgi:hypothetical protein